MVATVPFKIRTLKELRKENGMSQIELAKRLDIHRTTLNRYENDKLTATKSILCMAAMVLGYHPGEIKGYME